MSSELEITIQEKDLGVIIHISMNSLVAAMEAAQVVGVTGKGTERKTVSLTWLWVHSAALS